MKRVALALVCFVMILTGVSSSRPAQPVSPQTDEQYEHPVIAADPKVQSVLPSTPSPSPAASIIKASPPRISTVNIVAAGDLMCLYAQLCAAYENGLYSFDSSFSNIKDIISGADLAIGNLETLVAEGYKYTGRSPATGSPRLNAPESYLAALKRCGFDVLTTANNHAWDRQSDGLEKTLNMLDKYNFLHTGTNSGQRPAPLISQIKGIKIAILAYTDFINRHPRTDGKVDLFSERLLNLDIAAAKSAGADYIIVYIHWGRERTHKVTGAQKKEAEFIAHAGADLILGSHPHCTQGSAVIETDHGKVPVFYSLGNFVSSMGATICRDSITVNIELEKEFATGHTVLTGLTYTPIVCKSRFIIYPADEDSIAESDKPKSLISSRNRTIKVLGDIVAAPN